MLYRLMGRAVFTVAHRIVRKDENRRKLHQSREPDRRPRVVTEDKERGAERAKLGQGESVHSGCHRVLADTEVQVFTGTIFGLEISRAGVRQSRLVRRSEIG